MKRKGLLTVLFVFGFLFTTFFLFMFLVIGSVGKDLPVTGEGIGVVEIVGPIMDSRETVDQIRKYQRNDNIKAILLRIDSPGGAVAPSQEIYHAVLKARKDKKVVASMGSVAASGGDYIACAADRIFANAGTVTGSIGVITQLTNFTDLAEMAKVDVITIKSGQYKDVGNAFREFEEKDRQFFEQMVLNIYEQFVKDVSEARGMKLDDVRAVADGRVFTGLQALELGLVDELGTLYDSAEYLAGEVGLDKKDPNLIYPPEEEGDLLQQLVEGTVQGVATGVSSGVRKMSAPMIEYRYVGP
ncbi:MAG: signal peptide peptidase SppA [Myxococcales bacterium]|nr:signal peptide peptidase SppA [Myxococcales bacterium]